MPNSRTRPALLLDGSGDLYITDSDTNVVREVDLRTGVITTAAGNGAEGYSGDGGAATAAELSEPIGLAMDSSGDLFIADWWNSAVREVNPSTGIITTVAGGRALGYSGDGGPASVAELGNPTDVAVDKSGDLFIAESANNVVREVNAQTGDITTIAGNGTAGDTGDSGPATAAELTDPGAVAVDDSGDLYVVDSGNNTVREVNIQTGVITTIAGNGTDGYSGDGGPATSAELSAPEGVALNGSGDLLIGDSNNSVVREVNLKTGVITTVAGNGTAGDSGDDGPATAAELYRPQNVAVDSAGDLFIADSDNNAIREVNSQTGDIITIAGGGDKGYQAGEKIATATELSMPLGMALDGSGHLFFADSGYGVVRELDLKTGIITTVAGTANQFGFGGDGGPASTAMLGAPSGVAIDSAGNLDISDAVNNDVREVSTPTNVAQMVTVAKAPLTVTANNATKAVGASNPNLTYTITGFVNGDTASSLETPATVSTPASSSSSIGTYPIAVSGATSANYAIRFVGGTLTVIAPAASPAAPPRVTAAAFATSTPRVARKPKSPEKNTKHRAPSWSSSKAPSTRQPRSISATTT